MLSGPKFGEVADRRDANAPREAPFDGSFYQANPPREDTDARTDKSRDEIAQPTCKRDPKQAP